jgi:hypothetical protein
MFYSIKTYIIFFFKGLEEKQSFLHQFTFEISIFKGIYYGFSTLSFKAFFIYLFECENHEVLRLWTLRFYLIVYVYI